MAAQNPPINAAGYTVYIALQDMANAGSYKANPTLAAGDVKVSIDGGAFANLGTLPVVTPASGIAVKVVLSGAEMTGDNIFIQFIDQTAAKEWADYAFVVQTVAAAPLTTAQVNAEVVDALATDTYSQPGQEAPAATQTLAKMVAYLYKAFRNRKTVTSTTMSLYADDATTVDQKATVSDNGTTYDHGEIATGP